MSQDWGMSAEAQQRASYTFTPPSNFDALLLEVVELILDSSEATESITMAA